MVLQLTVVLYSENLVLPATKIQKIVKISHSEQTAEIPQLTSFRLETFSKDQSWTGDSPSLYSGCNYFKLASQRHLGLLCITQYFVCLRQFHPQALVRKKTEYGNWV